MLTKTKHSIHWRNSMLTTFLNNLRKPKGFTGRIAIAAMNVGHGRMTRGALDLLGVRPGSVTLDIGCGGGGAVARMAAMGARVFALDYSETAVAAAKRKNNKAIRQGRVTVEQGTVDELPYEDNMFDLVTAFETVYFWKNIQNNFKDVFRILKPGGRFAVIVEAYMENGKKVNSPALFDSLKLNLYSAEDFQAMAREAGFSGFAVLGKGSGSWKCFCCTKAETPATV